MSFTARQVAGLAKPLPCGCATRLTTSKLPPWRRMIPWLCLLTFLVVQIFFLASDFWLAQIAGGLSL